MSKTALPVAEGGTASYTVVLDSEPTGEVTVTPSRSGGDTDVTVSEALTFTPSTWDTAQTVTVSAAEDADAVNDSATVSHAVAGADYGANSVTAGDVAVTVSDDEAAPDVPGRVTGLTADATAARVALSWTAPSGAVAGYRVEASYDGGSSWAEVMADTGGAGTAYTHRSGLMAGETRHYRVSAIFGGGGGTGPASVAAEADATTALDGLTATGLAVEDTPHGEPTVDLCWKPTGVAASDLESFAFQKRRVLRSEPGHWSDEIFTRSFESNSADCEAGSIGLRTSDRVVANARYAFRVRARHGDGWALSNDAEAVSLDMTRDFRTEVMAGQFRRGGRHRGARHRVPRLRRSGDARERRGRLHRQCRLHDGAGALPRLRRGGRIRAGRRRDARQRDRGAHRSPLQPEPGVSGPDHPHRLGTAGGGERSRGRGDPC